MLRAKRLIANKVECTLHFQNSKRLFSFSPNRLITPAVLKILTTEQIRKVILFGEAGIGKTCAIVLYAYLSRIVTDDLLKNESRKKEVLEFIEK